MPKKKVTKKKDNTVSYYTDGSLVKQEDGRKYSAFSYVKVVGGKIVKRFTSPIENHATSNLMELKAVISACKDALNTYGTSPDVDIYIYTDSSYVERNVNDKNYERWLQNGWKNTRKKPVQHKKYWATLIKYLSTDKIHIAKVKGHSKNIMNTYVHNMVQNATIDAAYSG